MVDARRERKQNLKATKVEAAAEDAVRTAAAAAGAAAVLGWRVQRGYRR